MTLVGLLRVLQEDAAAGKFGYTDEKRNGYAPDRYDPLPDHAKVSEVADRSRHGARLHEEVWEDSRW